MEPSTNIKKEIDKLKEERAKLQEEVVALSDNVKYLKENKAELESLIPILDKEIISKTKQKERIDLAPNIIFRDKEIKVEVEVEKKVYIDKIVDPHNVSIRESQCDKRERANKDLSDSLDLRSKRLDKKENEIKESFKLINEANSALEERRVLIEKRAQEVENSIIVKTVDKYIDRPITVFKDKEVESVNSIEMNNIIVAQKQEIEYLKSTIKAMQLDFKVKSAKADKEVIRLSNLLILKN